MSLRTLYTLMVVHFYRKEDAMKHPAGYGLYIKKLAECMEAEANRSLQSHNLTFIQSKVLMTLMCRDGHIATMKELEAHFDFAQSTVAGLVSRMERKGLIESVPDETDRRIKRVRLTDDGIKLCEACWNDINASDEMLVSALDAQERKLLLHFLERIYESIR